MAFGISQYLLSNASSYLNHDISFLFGTPTHRALLFFVAAGALFFSNFRRTQLANYCAVGILFLCVAQGIESFYQSIVPLHISTLTIYSLNLKFSFCFFLFALSLLAQTRLHQPLQTLSFDISSALLICTGLSGLLSALPGPLQNRAWLEGNELIARQCYLGILVLGIGLLAYSTRLQTCEPRLRRHSVLIVSFSFVAGIFYSHFLTHKELTFYEHEISLRMNEVHEKIQNSFKLGNSTNLFNAENLTKIFPASITHHFDISLSQGDSFSRASQHHAFQKTHAFLFEGLRWNVTLTPRARYLSSLITKFPTFVFWGGVTLGPLLALLAAFCQRNRQQQHVIHRAHSDKITAMFQQQEYARELKRLEVLLNEITRTSHNLISVKDISGRYVLVNPAFENSLNRTQQDILGKTDIELFGEELSQSEVSRDKETLTAHSNLTFEEKDFPKKASQQYLTTKTLLRNFKGETVGIITIRQDNTQTKQVQEHLKYALASAEDANRTKSEFLAMMSHEIRTPLGAMLGFAELLQEHDIEAREKQEFLKTITKNGERLMRIFDDILDLSKAESNGFEIELTRFSVFRLVSEVASFLGEQAHEKGLHFETLIDESTPEFIESDPIRLRQILVYIVGNAIKFTDSGSVYLKIFMDPEGSLTEKASSLHLEISDSGPGIAKEVHDKLFQPFAQVDSSITRKFGGAGLGLVLSRKLAVLLGGDLELKSSELGKGTVFLIRIAPGNFTPPGTYSKIPAGRGNPPHSCLPSWN